MHAHTSYSARMLGLAALALLALSLIWPNAAHAQAAGPARVNIGDVLTLSARGRNIKEALAVRAGVVRIDTISPENPTVVKVTALRLGSTRIILTDENNGQIEYTIIVSPDLSHIQNAIINEFRTANVTVH